MKLKKYLPATGQILNSDSLLDGFLQYLKDKGIEPYAAQEEAILELFADKNVILNTPTGSGKSLVALAVHYSALATGRRSYYTSPIKALVNEKFFSLCQEFGPEMVGMITGDSTINPKAPIICCTAEILASDALREGRYSIIDDVVMDEFHYYSDKERGVAWQIPLLALPQSRFLLMSATMGDTEKFEKILTDLNGRETVTVKSTERPVPLDFQYSEISLHETVSQLLRNGRSPIYLVSFTQRECAEEAQNFMSIDLCTSEEKKKINEALYGFKFSSPYGKEIQKFLKHGMGLHHGGLLPKYRILVEKLAQAGLLKIIFGTDTLGVGVNIPLKTVLFTKLCKYDGTKTTILSVRDFLQISGRAGRKGFDTLGTVVVQAPEHIIENLRNERKAEGDPKKIKKLVKKKPPEKGFIPWNKDTFQRLIQSPSEPLISRFQVSHSMLLQVLSRPLEDGCRSMQKLIHSCHENRDTKKKLFANGFELFRSLVERNIIEFNPLRVNVDLQEDFSLNHALSLYLLDTLRLLDRNDPNYALDVLTLTESILESPDLILRKQLDKIKSAKLIELKMQGMEFDQRIEELEKLEYPKPLRNFIYDSFNEFARQHPWVGQENIRPKSIAREIYEGFFSFGEYIREYDLYRTEGLLLRYVSDVYKALSQNIPDFAKNEALFEIGVYFESMVRQIDSSLLDEWENLKNPQKNSQLLAGENGDASQVKAPEWDRKSFTIKVRNEVFRFIKLLAQKDFDEALVMIENVQEKSVPKEDSLFDSEKLRVLLETYYQAGHQRICADTKARGTQNLKITYSDNGKTWIAEQIITDPDDYNDWIATFHVDIIKSQEELRPVMSLVYLGPAEELL